MCLLCGLMGLVSKLNNKQFIFIEPLHNLLQRLVIPVSNMVTEAEGPVTKPRFLTAVLNLNEIIYVRASLVAEMVKNLPAVRPRFNIWVRKIPWRREWLPTPVFLPGEYVNFYNSYHLLSTYYVPVIDLNFLCALIYSVFIIALWSRYYYSDFYRWGNWGREVK